MWKDLKVGTRILAGFGLVVVLVALTGVVGLTGMSNVDSQAERVALEEAPISDATNEMLRWLAEGEVALRQFRSGTSVMDSSSENTVRDARSRWKNSVDEFDGWADAIVNGADDADRQVRATDNAELRSLVESADDLHNNALQGAAARMMKAGDETLASFAARNASMVSTEDKYDVLMGALARAEDRLAQVAGGGTAALAMSDALNELKYSAAASRIRGEEAVQQRDGAVVTELQGEFRKDAADARAAVALLVNGGTWQGVYVPRVRDAALLSMIGSVDAGFAAYEEDCAALFTAQLELVAINATSDAAMADVEAAISDASKVLAKVEEETSSEMASAIAEADEAYQTTALLLVLMTLLSAGAGLGIGVFTGRSITQPIGEMVDAAGELARGNINIEVHSGRNDEVGALAGAFQQMIDAQQRKSEVARQLSRGNLSVDVDVASDADVLGQSMREMKAALELLVRDVQTLARAGVAGKLSTRADAGRHQGEYANIVRGVNDTLDAVVHPVQEAARVLDALAAFDLRVRVQGDYRGDHAAIKQSLNRSAGALHDAMSQVAESVEQIAAAGGEIASASQSVAQGSSEQASSLEETSASLEEMSSMTQQNADNTQQARALARATSDAADKGGVAMDQMLDAMVRIREAAEGAAEIIRDINEIAFQTNLLALNAAVEAARAGDAGRGFAVVAEEVRNLAQRSKEAANKTEDLIQQSVTLAGEGQIAAQRVHGTLSEIVGSVGKVTGLVDEIAVASEEQTRGIGQISSAVAQMDSVTQQAAANAEESSSAAEELASQASELESVVRRFQLNRGSGGFRSAAPRAALMAPEPPRLMAPPRSPAPSSSRSAADRLIPFDDDDLADFEAPHFTSQGVGDDSTNA